ncbi:MAG: helix-turn-helix domain-containing protein [Rhodospirillaceae bacterium]|nr:helix-turn-helix domain-containing protein [Rhodospirillaceae bacterium]
MLSIETLPPEWRDALQRIPVDLLLALAGSTRDQRAQQEFLTRPQAAKHLGVSVSFLNKLAAKGTGPVITRLGSAAVRYKRADLDAWLDSRRATNASTRKR